MPVELKRIDLLPAQLECFNLDVRVGGMCGGIGSGKTYYLGAECVRYCATEDPRSQILAMANTKNQLDKSFLQTLKEIFGKIGLDFVAGRQAPPHWNVPLRDQIKHWQNTVIVETGHVITTGSFEQPDDIRGAEYGLALLEEIAFTPNGYGFDVVLGRMRCKHASKQRVRFATSPPDYPNWFWEIFASPQKRKGYKIVHCSSHSNHFLGKEYLEDLKESYSDEDYDREILGLFVFRGSNRCYTEYDPEKHNSEWEYVPGMEVLVGADFNRSPLCWCYAQEDQNGVLHFFDELFIEREATTVQACEETLEKFPESNIHVWPDFSATFKQTSGVIGLESDANIIRSYGMDVVTPFAKNPLQGERIESVQDRLRHGKMKVSENCPKLRASLQTTMYIPNSRRIAKSTKVGDVGEHMSDAAGYLVVGYDSGPSVMAVGYDY